MVTLKGQIALYQNSLSEMIELIDKLEDFSYNGNDNMIKISVETLDVLNSDYFNVINEQLLKLSNINNKLQKQVSNLESLKEIHTERLPTQTS